MSIIDQAIIAFNQNGFKAKKFLNMAQAKQAVLQLFGKDEVIGVGGSMTIKDSGILQALDARGQSLLAFSFGKHYSPEESIAIRRQAMNADWYFTSSNAITTTGELVNIDGHGNRVAGMIYGPSKVLVLVGKNKLSKNFNTALGRIRTDACGKNARRLKRSTPCALDDKCHSCNHPQRMCNVIACLQRPTSWHTDFYVFIIEEDWGY